MNDIEIKQEIEKEFIDDGSIDVGMYAVAALFIFLHYWSCCNFSKVDFDMSVYKAINKVQAALSRHGISKTNTNAQQGYKFRGIDDVFNALSPLLAEHSLCILPRCTERICTERINAKGTALFYVTVKCEFDFVSADDGSKHTITTFGEAMDSGDKATNKAMSAAYKYAAFQAFSIPTEGDNDADAQTHDVRPLSLDSIIKSETLEELKASYESAIRNTPKQHHAAIIKAKDDRKAQLTEQ